MSDQLNLHGIKPSIICLGSHPGIIQSMLDYDYCLGQPDPNITVIVSGGRKQERYFFGQDEIVIPVYGSLSTIPDEKKQAATGLLNVQSARRALSSMREAFEQLPNLEVANIFAEQVPEQHALEIALMASQNKVLVAGPASVGLLVPGVMKLGAIGGTQYPQLAAAKVFTAGDTAVVSTSGGMVNELIHTVTSTGLGVSLAMALGGDRNPITTPAEAFLIAEADEKTKRIVYFGELGGDDEYSIVELIKDGIVTKPVITYIAGTVAELFEEPPQFGHAKAMASQQSETAKVKKEALRAVGANVVDVFGDLTEVLSGYTEAAAFKSEPHKPIKQRRKSLIVSRISGDVKGDVHLLGKDLLTTINENSLAGLYISLLLGHQVESAKVIDFTDYVLRLLVDHGPYVSGAVNTIVAARAGKDLASSLTAGLLTVGPRFGGAVNAAAGIWLEGVTAGAEPKTFVAGFTSNGGIIPGIGHKKYRIDTPDPRVRDLIERFSGNGNQDRYLRFAQGIESVTTSKKANLILNVDGAIAAIMLDLLESELDYKHDQLQELVDIEFFNAIFILSRSAGFMAHYLDQRRHDEGLLRLGEDDVAYIP
ncbi:MAG TPA: citrate/2-methylcitrate synthase [Candidatus Saccharimonadales bacterium]|nr:citrate/2-methylcitrate synthase [Candidatus Saccharimonadales bacterium]